MMNERRTQPYSEARDSAIAGAGRPEIHRNFYSPALETPLRPVSAQKPALSCHTAQENARNPGPM